MAPTIRAIVIVVGLDPALPSFQQVHRDAIRAIADQAASTYVPIHQSSAVLSQEPELCCARDAIPYNRVATAPIPSAPAAANSEGSELSREEEADLSVKVVFMLRRVLAPSVVG